MSEMPLQQPHEITPKIEPEMHQHTPNHHPRAPSSSKSKTIKPPGSNTTRVSVACDRCRKKKIRCFYDNDDVDIDDESKRQCANCKVVGLECIFTDKLARKAFPRGYTESLEERVRELEYENKKLQKLLSLKTTDDNDTPTIKVKHEHNHDDPDIDMMDDSTNMRNTSNATSTNSNLDIANNANIDNSDIEDDDIKHDTPTIRETNNTPQANSAGDLLSRSGSEGPTHMLNTENVSRLDSGFKQPNQPNSISDNNNFLNIHTHDENCNCGMHHSLINRPVSIAGSVDIDHGDLSDDDSLYSGDSRQNSVFPNQPFSPPNDSNTSISHIDHHEDDSKHRFVFNPNSFEQINAPGAAAAISLQNKLRTKNFLNLANLIAASIPRSTEETLFIPTLLARIIKTHGFDSKAPYLTARSIALLKQAYNEEERYNLFPITFKGVNFNDLNKIESKTFFQSLNLPNNMNLDICITIFFNTWNTIIPVMNKEIFMANYKKFIRSRDLDYEDGEMIGFEKFGEVLVIITCLVMISNERSNIAHKLSNNSILEENNDPEGGNKISSNSEILQFYDHLIKQLIQSNMSSICSISSLQIITIELLYCLATDDLTTSYELRGRMITMCQQLRLHRCPAAVLGSNGSSVSKLQQGERRILFWCIYTLDSFSAFILGVPRLLKDYEIECALPSSSSTSSDESREDDTSFITFQNNVQLSLVGKVCDSALSIMRYSKILGTIVDSIFKRSEGLKQTNINESKCLIMEDLLETWRRNLPATVSFNSVHNSKDINVIDNLNETQLTLYYLYYQAKALIYMPLLASESAYNNLSTSSSSKCSPAFISIQQATTSILTTMKVLNTSKHHYYFLPLPINIARQMARFSLMAARNSLEYTRGGSLFQEAKLLLNCIINELKIENKIGLLGCLSNNCISCLEHAIDAILSQPKLNGSNLDPVESVKKESKKKATGSPLKKVSTNSEKVEVVKKVTTLSNTVNNNKRKIAINDIFSNKEKEEVKQEPDLFNFMSEDPNAMEEESLNMILKNVDGDEDIGNNPDLLLEKQKMLIKQKQQFLQAQQENLKKQILLLQSQARQQQQQQLQLEQQKLQQQQQQQQLLAMTANQHASVPVPIQIQGEIPAEIDSMGYQMDTPTQEQTQFLQQLHKVQTNSNIVNNYSNMQQPMGSPVQMDNSETNSNAVNYNSVKSFSDLLMFNDFGVDASLGLPLIDFELDSPAAAGATSSGKKQKVEDFEEMYGYHNGGGREDGDRGERKPASMTFEESPEYNPYAPKRGGGATEGKKKTLFSWSSGV